MAETNIASERYSKFVRETDALVSELRKTLEEKNEEIRILQEKVLELSKIQLTYQYCKVEYEKLQTDYENLKIKMEDIVAQNTFLVQTNEALQNENSGLQKSIVQKQQEFEKFVAELNQEKINTNKLIESLASRKSKIRQEEQIKDEGYLPGVKKEPNLQELIDRLKWTASSSVFYNKYIIIKEKYCETMEIISMLLKEELEKSKKFEKPSELIKQMQESVPFKYFFNKIHL